MSSQGPPNLAHGQHVMLLYNSDDERKAAAIDYISEGLKNGQLCIYASVGAYDSVSGITPTSLHGFKILKRM